MIVIDGIDGSGKAIQSALLVKRLKDRKVKVKVIDFPRYYDNFFGKLVGEYLSGKFGDFIKTDPKIASVLYAADRFESAKEIEEWLKSGYIVVADRYTSSNQIHQGGKISSISERKIFLNWLLTMEHDVFKIPRPDLIIYLDVPLDISKKWLKNKISQRNKKYLKGRRDVAEDNLLHLNDSRDSALFLSKTNKNWEKVSCCKGATCLTPEQVHEEVFKIVKEKLKV